MKYTITVTFPNGVTKHSFKGFTKTFKSETAMVDWAVKYFSSQLAFSESKR